MTVVIHEFEVVSDSAGAGQPPRAEGPAASALPGPTPHDVVLIAEREALRALRVRAY